MARSKEAIRRRAQKRNRTVEEQQKIDWKTHQKQLEQREETEKGRNTNLRDGTLSKCDANNTANPGTTSPEKRETVLVGGTSVSLSSVGDTIIPESRDKSPDSLRRRRPQSNTLMTPTTNQMQPSWGIQADATTIEANRRLREEYQKTGGKGMSQGDQERARILFARDKRKQEKKRRQKQTKTTDAPPKTRITSTNGRNDMKVSKSAEKNDSNKSSPNKMSANESKEARKRNKALRKRYRETNGEGMAKDEQERARILIARDERKNLKREALKNGDDKTKDGNTEPEVSTDAKNERPAISTTFDKKARKALRKRFKKTNGEGMTMEELVQAKNLIARRERKQQKRAAAEQDLKSRKRHKKGKDADNIQHSIQKLQQ